MEIKTINNGFSVSDQITAEDLKMLSDKQIKSIICNRPDNEAENQPSIQSLEQEAAQHQIEIHYLPVVHDTISAKDVHEFELAFNNAAKPVHAYCRSGLRAITLWSLMQIKQGTAVADVVAVAQGAGFDFNNFVSKFSSVIESLRVSVNSTDERAYDALIIGGGAAGISVASSLLKRDASLEVAIIDPADTHYYQPGFTMVGGGVFNLDQTRRPMDQVMPDKISWIKAAVTSFNPEENYVLLDSGTQVSYQQLVVCPGLKLNWQGVDGLAEALGRNGVTSNYSPETAPYTWDLVENLKSGKAIFTQPPMPIKCAGAPQKALYLSADQWLKRGLLNDINIEFCNAGAVLFGVKEYVPALQTYMDKYQVKQSYGHNLTKVDGENKKAWFVVTNEAGESDVVERDFDMLHVCPPQQAPDFIRDSALSDEAGWVDVDQHTLQHKKYSNIWSLGDVANTPNAKTAAAVRVQAPIVAHNLLQVMQEQQGQQASYNGYGSCPLTVERGKIVLAEFGYGGALLPTFPKFVLEGTQPTKTAWFLKEKILPKVYWDGMLKGKEWLVAPG
jgi:sulfide:quinone oxidoreductase